MEIDLSNPTDEFVHSIDIHRLLPQQDPFVLIGRLEHFSWNRVVTSLEILSDNIFVEGGEMSAYGFIENIAQTCAARIGYINGIILKKKIQIGYVGAVKNFVINALPSVGDVIFTEIEILEEAFGLLLVSATVKTREKTLATTVIKIALQDA